MHRIDGSTRSATLPAPSAAGTGPSSPGYFGHGDPVAGVSPTVPTVDWANSIQEEIAAVIEHSGTPLDKNNNGQLLAALLSTFVAQGESSGVVIGTAEATIPLPGGFQIKVGTIAGSYSEGQIAHTFDNPFPAKCWAVIPIGINTSGANNRDAWPQRVSLSAAGFALFNQWTGVGSTTGSIDGVDFIAIGN